MKRTFFQLLLTVLSLSSLAQSKPAIKKSWIRMEAENLSGNEGAPDTLYTRYTFSNQDVRMSFYPGWDDYKQEWSLDGEALTIGFTTYQVEELTDSSLTISASGFRRFKFLAEDYLSSKDENLQLIGEYNGKPLYKANRYITPRYKKEKLQAEIGKGLEGYRNGDAAYFLASFVVTTEGKVENVQIVRGISEGFDRECTKQVLKTSKNWRPATFKGHPVQTQVMYEIKYLSSLSPYKPGRLN